MYFEWDAEKADTNLLKHGVSFDMVRRFSWETAFTLPDRRQEYGEQRWVSIGLIGSRLFKIVYVVRGDRVRLISAHKANRRDQRKYHERCN